MIHFMILTGVFAFHHGHSHGGGGGHNHSHSHSHSHDEEPLTIKVSNSYNHMGDALQDPNHPGHSHADGLRHGHSHDNHGHSHSQNHSHSDHSHSHGHSHDDGPKGSIIMQGVFLHILADALGSVGVIVSAILMQLFGWMIADPICSVFIAVMIAVSVVGLIKESMEILMQRQPRQLDRRLSGCYQQLARLEGVRSVQVFNPT